MIEKAQNKIIGAKENNVAIKTAIKDFFFPAYQITVKATDLEEAKAKLLAIINKKDNE